MSSISSLRFGGSYMFTVVDFIFLCILSFGPLPFVSYMIVLSSTTSGTGLMLRFGLLYSS